MAAISTITPNSSVFIVNPSTPTITNGGAAGTKTWGYKVVAVATDGTTTAASSEGTTSTGNAALDGTNYNIVTWTKVAGAASYKIYRTTNGASSTPTTLGLIGTATQPVGATQSFNDTGLAGDASTASTFNGTGVSAAVDVMHDQATAIQYAGTYSATMQLQESVNGTDWENLGSTVNSNQIVQLSGRRSFLRMAFTAFTSGTPVITLISQYPSGHR